MTVRVQKVTVMILNSYKGENVICQLLDFHLPEEGVGDGTENKTKNIL